MRGQDYIEFAFNTLGAINTAQFWCMEKGTVRVKNTAQVCHWALNLPFSAKHLGRVVRKPVNANPGLKVNRRLNFSCIKMVFASYFLSSLRLFKFKREGQKI